MNEARHMKEAAKGRMSCRAVYAMQAKPLEKATFGYDFRETSSSSHQQVVKKVKKSDISATFDHQGTHHDTPSPNQFGYMQLHSFYSSCIATSWKVPQPLPCEQGSISASRRMARST